MNNLHILANYPPKDWLNKKNTQAEDDNQKKLVYVGSLSLQATYIRECCTWVEQQGGKVSLDIFSYNLDSETKAYLNALNSQWITFNDKGIEYYNLPNFLGDYDIGLIIYKPYSDNVKYCASNKLFEYMVCGLDVWFSNIMEGTHSYICETSHPRVIDVNFEQLSHYSEEKLFGNGMLSYNPPQYSCEDEYEKLYKVIISEV